MAATVVVVGFVAVSAGGEHAGEAKKDTIKYNLKIIIIVELERPHQDHQERAKVRRIPPIFIIECRNSGGSGVASSDPAGSCTVS